MTLTGKWIVLGICKTMPLIVAEDILGKVQPIQNIAPGHVKFFDSREAADARAIIEFLGAAGDDAMSFHTTSLGMVSQIIKELADDFNKGVYRRIKNGVEQLERDGEWRSS